MSWALSVRKQVFKYLARVPRGDAERITAIIRGLAVNPYDGDVEKMGGETNVWRRRVGSYRVFYEIRQGQRVVYVFHVERRTSSTY